VEWVKRKLCRSESQQVFASGEEIDQSAGSEQPVGVFPQASVAEFDKAEVELEHSEDMLNARTGFGFDAVPLAFLGVDEILGAPAA